ncbi:serine/threonine protein kinase [Trichocoleus sp. FACHB-6]|uniref:serine/threonine-protein kinase n=1 Tax=Cyanophyceae TaxID=3028117 RepID=UPI0016821FA6|nr:MULTISPECIES: serine/threonine-protein kinase [unclassified Trichocoleus]MBD1905757.1 serine/threonine protein kinase [Trichocoleus sp. FACHB-832]MBD2065898.1 serine/threonine protein kinase [Trichocoleus sp. FACHB-6]
MSYCLNPTCPNPQNPTDTKFCITCGTKLLLKERYRAIKPIGQGGFGRTFLAVDEDKPSKPPCVIKQFYPQAQGTSTVQKAVELFNQEAVRLDELGKHPQIPELLAYFTQDDRQYLVQEFIDGQNLAEELSKVGAFNETQILQLLNDLLPVLQFVHNHQVIHRDIKPENIIRRSRDTRLVIVDFGASKFATGAALLKTGTSIGSPEYVAPEQARGKATFVSDIYSLGVTCIHLLTQMSPFDLYDINEDAWVWRQFLTFKVSGFLGKILDKMLQTAVSRRYQSAAEVLKDLNQEQKQATTPTVATPAKPVHQSPPAITPVVTTSASKSKSLVDDELAEMRSQFLEASTSKNENQKSTPQKPSSPNPAQSKSQVDLELEELKSQFLGSPKPKKPPTQT